MENISEQLCAECRSYMANPDENIKETLLCFTLSAKHDKCVEVLLQAGADVNWFNDTSYTPFMGAILKGYMYGVQSLLRAGADVNAEYNSNTALHLASQHSSCEIINLLIHAGADVNKVPQDGITALMRAMPQHNYDAFTNEQKKCIDLLLEAGADVNLECRGHTALHRASYHGLYQVVDALIRAGANVNKVPECGLTPLIEASTKHNKNTPINDYVKCVELLIQAGADVNTISDIGSALTRASCNISDKNADNLQLLIRAGADALQH